MTRRIKSNNEEIYEVVNKIFAAIRQERQIAFLYYEYDMNKKLILRNNGEKYQFSPYDMAWNDGNLSCRSTLI